MIIIQISSKLRPVSIACVKRRLRLCSITLNLKLLMCVCNARGVGGRGVCNRCDFQGLHQRLHLTQQSYEAKVILKS